MKEDVKLVIKRSLEHFSSVNLCFSIVSNSHQWLEFFLSILVCLIISQII